MYVRCSKPGYGRPTVTSCLSVQKLCRHARFQNHSGVVCGHIHVPQLEIVDGLLYLNTGDWVENASLVMETADGDIELFNHDCLVEKISKQELSDKTNSSLEPRIPDLERCPTPINEFSLEGLANEFRDRIHNYHLKAG